MKLFGKKQKIEVIEIGEGIEIKTEGKKGDVQKIVLPEKDRNRHLFSFGTTGVGKTRLIEGLAEHDIKKGRNVLIIDPKGDGELLNKIYDTAVKSGRKDDFMLINPIYPEHSSKINPLSNYFMPEELVGHIVAGVEVGNEPFFYNVSYEISLAIVLSFLEIAKNKTLKPEFNFLDIKKFISRNSLGLLFTTLKSINTSESNRLAADIFEIIKSPADYYGKISSSLRVALTELSQGNIGKIVGNDYHNEFIDRIESKSKGLVAVVQLGSLITRKASYTLGKVICSMIQSSVGRIYASNGKYHNPLVLYLDEAQSVLYKGIEELFAKGGSANLWVNAFCQSVSQMEDKLGKTGANAILDCTNTKIFMRVPDPESAEYITKFFPEKRTIRSNYSIEGGVSGMSEKEPSVKIESVMRLQPRDFFMSTYTGTYRGKIKIVNSCQTSIKFPVIGSRHDEPENRSIPEIPINEISSGWTNRKLSAHSKYSDLSRFLDELLDLDIIEDDEKPKEEPASQFKHPDPKESSLKTSIELQLTQKEKEPKKIKSAADRKAMLDPVEQENKKFNEAAFKDVKIDKVMAYIARSVNIIKFDKKQNKPRWKAATINDKIVVESELVWQAIRNQLDQSLIDLTLADQDLRFGLQRSFIQKLKEKKLLFDDIKINSKGIGSKLNIKLLNDKEFIFFGMVFNKHAFSKQQGNKFNHELPKGIQNLKSVSQNQNP
mgnify:CR=1 FL=1